MQRVSAREWPQQGLPPRVVVEVEQVAEVLVDLLEPAP